MKLAVRIRNCLPWFQILAYYFLGVFDVCAVRLAGITSVEIHRINPDNRMRRGSGDLFSVGVLRDVVQAFWSSCLEDILEVPFLEIITVGNGSVGANQLDDFVVSLIRAALTEVIVTAGPIDSYELDSDMGPGRPEILNMFTNDESGKMRGPSWIFH